MMLALLAAPLVLTASQAQLQPAQALVLTLPQEQLRQSIGSPGFVVLGRKEEQQAKIEITSTDGFPPALRSRCWWVAGGYGLGAAFASISGIITENVVRSQSMNATTRNARTNALGMALGFVIGGLPGALLGNEARYEENSLARGVTTLMAIGGTVALMATANQLFRPF